MSPNAGLFSSRRAAVGTFWLWAWVAWVNVGCMEFSPFETDLAAGERDLTAKQLTRIRALPEATLPLRFALIADSHQHYDALADVVGELNRRDDVAFVVHLGDLSDQGLRQEFRWAQEQLSRLRVPYLTVIGNHDAISNGQHVYREMFGEYDYTFDHGGVRFVIFNSNSLEFEHVSPDPDWLAAATRLDAGTGKVVAFTHQPPHSPGYIDTLQNNGVSGLFVAHLHSFDVQLEGAFLTVRVGEAGARRWVVAEVNADELRVQECTMEGCTWREP